MDQLMSMLDPWTWWIVAGLLLIVELMVPTIFFMWLGIAAAATGLLHLVLPLSWQMEVAIFCALSVIFLLAGRPWMLKRQALVSDQPNLNKRMYNFIGKVYPLDKPIVRGHGSLTIDDTHWKVSGPDLKAGNWVKVTGVDGLTLQVEPSERS